ncbi:MAG: P-II family nitrogen regulator [Cytophagales bacterium]
MKKIQAIIRASKFDDVRDALHDIGVEYFIYYEVKGVSFQNEKKGSYRGASIIDTVAAIPRRVVEVIVPEIDTEEVVYCIKKAASTGEAGDGKIYISPVDSGVRISIV